jgi:hypothetical protein
MFRDSAGAPHDVTLSVTGQEYTRRIRSIGVLPQPSQHVGGEETRSGIAIEPQRVAGMEQ